VFVVHQYCRKSFILPLTLTVRTQVLLLLLLLLSAAHAHAGCVTLLWSLMAVLLVAATPCEGFAD
jgi:hypothetical protein